MNGEGYSGSAREDLSFDFLPEFRVADCAFSLAIAFLQTVAPIIAAITDSIQPLHISTHNEVTQNLGLYDSRNVDCLVIYKLSNHFDASLIFLSLNACLMAVSAS